MKTPMQQYASRFLIIIITLALAVASLSVSGAQRKTGPKTDQPPAAACRTNVDALSALTMLKDGNRRWTGPPPPRMKSRNWPRERRATEECQRPFAAVIACMDSRVPPELIFDQGLGDLFVIRVAGPVLNPDELASLEYALVEMNVKLVVVLGHTDCGAVKGAVGEWNPSWRYLPELLTKLKPAITSVSSHYNGGEPIKPTDKKNVNRVSIANARLVRSEIPSFPSPNIKLTWGLYNTGTGVVAFEPKEPWLR